MITHKCDQCDIVCEADRITYKEVVIWGNGVGRSVDGNVDLCSITCLRLWLFDTLRRNGFSISDDLLVFWKV